MPLMRVPYRARPLALRALTARIRIGMSAAATTAAMTSRPKTITAALIMAPLMLRDGSRLSGVVLARSATIPGIAPGHEHGGQGGAWMPRPQISGRPSPRGQLSAHRDF